MTMDPIKTNQLLWDSWIDAHTQSELYDLMNFLAGKTSLRHIELNELGDVSGKSLVHFQCHFGMDTLSLARMGAQVTGVDFSQKAIEFARNLAEQLKLPARFIQSNLMNLPDVLDETFDLVFTSYGAICWLSDIDRWAEIVAAYLKPGGSLYMVEFHPIVYMFNGKGQPDYPYFATESAWPEDSASYADDKGQTQVQTCFTWPHHMGEIVTSLLKAGLQLQFLHEYPFTPINCFGFLEEQGEQRFVVGKHIPQPPGGLPLTFSLRATRT